MRLRPSKAARGDGCAEVVAAAGVVLDVGVGARDRGLDALAYVLGGGHRPSVEDRRGPTRRGSPGPAGGRRGPRADRYTLESHGVPAGAKR